MAQFQGNTRPFAGGGDDAGYDVHTCDPGPLRLRQEDQFRTSLNNLMRLCRKIKKKMSTGDEAWEWNSCPRCAGPWVQSPVPTEGRKEEESYQRVVPLLFVDVCQGETPSG